MTSSNSEISHRLDQNPLSILELSRISTFLLDCRMMAWRTSFSGTEVSVT